MEVAGLPGRTCTPITAYFHDKTKISKENLQVDVLLFTAKIFQEAMCLTSLQSCKSGRAFRVGFGLKVDKNFGLDLGLRRTFCLRFAKI